MVKISDLISAGAELLQTIAENPRSEARILLAHTLGVSISHLLVHSEEMVPEDMAELFKGYISMRTRHMPIAYITGEKEFFGLKFAVNEHTLIPRPETEMVVEEILASGKNKLLDLCTGSGCIPIASAANSTLSALGIDISSGAVKMAAGNAEKHGLSNRVTFEVSDVFEKKYFGKFDIISSNPPYITDADMLTLPPDVAEFEPRAALAGGKDGLVFYRRITEIAPYNLLSDGILIFEIGVGEGTAVANLMKKNFTDIKIKKDLAGIDRIVCGKLKGETNV